MVTMCEMPFSFAEILPNGNVYPCCSAFNRDYAFGNIFLEGKDVWNSQKARSFRKNILNGDYSVCDMETCFKKVLHCVPNDSHFAEEMPLPTTIKLSYDYECNLQCITCQDKIIINSDDMLSTLNERFDTYILPFLCNTREVCLNGSGDPLFSRHSLTCIKRITAVYPKVCFSLHTNGLYCDRNTLETLGISERISLIQISVHAATENTYLSICRGGDFQRLVDNINYVASYIIGGGAKLQLLFVVHADNFQEIPKFVEWVHRLGENVEALFWEYRYWGTEFGTNFESVNIISPTHPQHLKLSKIVCEMSKCDNVYLSPALLKIRNEN